MPRNGKEGILFSFIMSAIMIYVMTALNYYVRVFLEFGEFPADWAGFAWLYALLNFPLAYVIGMVCDLGFCSPASRRIMLHICHENDRGTWRFFVVKFGMVVLMTICMTAFGVFAAVGFGLQDISAFCLMFPFNFTIALPIQMLIVAPLSSKLVYLIGDTLHWNEELDQGDASANSVAGLIESDVFCVDKTASVKDAMALIIEKNISGMPIVDMRGAVVGFVSDSDILRKLADEDLYVADIGMIVEHMHTGSLDQRTARILDRNVMEVATVDVVSVDTQVHISELYSLFGVHSFKKIPVIEQGKLVGIINRSTLTHKAMSRYAA